MKNVKIKHNPYTLVTEFEVEGKKLQKIVIFILILMKKHVFRNGYQKYLNF
jgi:hypothetical protein